MSSQYLSSDEILALQKRLVGVLDFLGTNKTRIRPMDYSQLNNHIHFALTTLTNMSNVISVERSDPYGQSQYGEAIASGQTGRTVVYNADGTTRIVRGAEHGRTGDAWEAQFDETLLQRPPSYMAPPQQLSSIPKIKQSGDWNRLKGL